MQNVNQKEYDFTVDDLVRYYKYYKRQINENITLKMSLKKVPTKTCYKKYKKVFDKLFFILKKYNLNPVRYIKYCVLILHPTKWCEEPKNDLLLFENFKKYAEYTKERELYFKIYKIYMNDVDYISNKCIELNKTPIEYIRYLIVNNKIAYEFFGGSISKYFLASIPQFKEIYKKLDNLNKEELKSVYNICEELNKDVQNAFLMIKSHQITPISLITKTIENKKLENKL